MTRNRQLAKLSRPRLHRTVARIRLFALLDEAGHSSVTWLEGPPGAGKTTVVASWVDIRHRSPLWYRLDRADADASTFFHYLSEGASLAMDVADPALPVFGPERQSEVAGFAHRYFRALFSQLPDDAVLVLDDYHELPSECDVHRILAAAVSEVPEGCRILVASRAPPPAEFARSELSGSLTRIDWAALRLSPEEVLAIAASRGQALGSAAATSLQERSNGWVAAVCLWLDRKDPWDADREHPASTDPEPLFRYLAAEVFARETPASRELLLATCLVPAFTRAEATKLCGRTDVETLLEDLFRRQLFIERTGASEAGYRYHDLFRSFLRAAFLERCGSERLVHAACRSGQVLMASGRLEEAFPLLVDGGDWDTAESACLEAAPALVRQGRGKILQAWCEALPAERVNCNPWLEYWQGRAVTLRDPAAALQMLVRANGLFEALGDRRGQALAIAGVLDALHFDVRAFDRIPPWLHRLAEITRAGLPPMTADEALPVHAAVMVSSSHLCMPSADLDNAVQCVTTLLDQCADPDLVLSVANMVHYYSGHCLDAHATEAASAAARARLNQPTLSTDRLALYWLAEGHAHYTFGRFKQALECFDRADRVIADNELRHRRLVAGTWRCQCLAMAGDVPGAQAVLASLESHLSTLPGFVEALYLWATSIVEYTAGHLERSIELGARAVVLNRRSGSAISTALWVPRLCVRLLEAGRGDEATTTLQGAGLTERAIAYTCQQAGVALVEAWAKLRAGQRDDAAASLRHALRAARSSRERIRLRWFVPAVAALSSFGIELDIEPDMIRDLVTEFGILPPSHALEGWPWPVRITTLGRFELAVNGKPLAFGRKLPRRTLALLTAIVASGGRQVPESRLSDDLWPDLDGDAAHEAFAAALHRLRRLLGTNEAIVQSGRTVSLDCKRCFVDTWALDAALQSAEGISRTLALYRGPFMPGDESPSSVAMRASLRSRVGRAVRNCVSVLEAGGDLSQAESVMAQALDADPAMFG